MATVLCGLAVTDDGLVRLSDANPGYRFERVDDGRLVVSPTSTDGGGKSGEAFGQLRDYAKRAGGKAYDSSTGFEMPGGAGLSPDAAWIAAERIARFDAGERHTFRRVAPDAVTLVASPSDDPGDVRAKDRPLRSGRRALRRRERLRDRYHLRTRHAADRPRARLRRDRQRVARGIPLRPRAAVDDFLVTAPPLRPPSPQAMRPRVSKGGQGSCGSPRSVTVS